MRHTSYCILVHRPANLRWLPSDPVSRQRPCPFANLRLCEYLVKRTYASLVKCHARHTSHALWPSSVNSSPVSMAFAEAIPERMHPRFKTAVRRQYQALYSVPHTFWRLQGSCSQMIIISSRRSKFAMEPSGPRSYQSCRVILLPGHSPVGPLSQQKVALPCPTYIVDIPHLPHTSA